MTTDFFALTLFSSGALRTLLCATLASSAAIVLVLMLRWPCCRILGAAAAYAIWILVPIAAAVALVPPTLRVAPAPLTPAAIGAPVPMFQANPHTSSFLAHADLGPWLSMVWLVGFLAAVAVFVYQQRRFIRSLGRLSVVSRDVLRAQTASGCPALIGAWRPRIVVPIDFEQRYSSSERELILAHERSHRLRGDAQFNLLAAALRCVFWFNPFIHIAASRFRFDQELACDAAVISRFPRSRRSYADAMLKTQLVEFGLPIGCHWQSLPLSQSGHPLKERILMLKKPLPGRARATLGAAIAIGFVASGSYTAWAAQPAVRVDAITASASSPLAGVLPRIRRKHSVEYPQSMVDSGIKGVIGVRAYIDSQGNVTGTSIVFSHPETVRVLEGAAIASIQSWTFDPPISGGRPIASSIVVPVRFRIDGQDDTPMPPLPADAWDGVLVLFESPSAPMDASSRSSPKVAYVDLPAFRPDDLNPGDNAKIIVKIRVDETGVARSAVVDSMQPPELNIDFAASAIASAMEGRYTPSISNGRPVADDLLLAFTVQSNLPAADR